MSGETLTTTTTGRPWAWTHRRREGCQCRAMRPILRHAGPDPTSCWLLKAWPPASVSCPIGREVTSTRPSAPACGAAGGCRTGARREATSRATNPGSRIFRAFPRAWRQVGFDKVRGRWNEGRGGGVTQRTRLREGRNEGRSTLEWCGARILLFFSAEPCEWCAPSNYLLASTGVGGRTIPWYEKKD